jgi:hypothetical protein
MKREFAMHCRKVERLLSHYIDGQTNAAVQSAIDDHLTGCASCSAAYECLKRTMALTEAGGTVLPPESYWEQFWPRLQERIETEAAARDIGRAGLRDLLSPRRTAISFAPVAAMMITALIMVNVFLHQGRKNRETIARQAQGGVAPSLLCGTPIPLSMAWATRGLPSSDLAAPWRGDIILCGTGGSEGVDEFILHPIGHQRTSISRPDTDYVLPSAPYGGLPALRPPMH